MRKARALCPGDVVGLVAPAGAAMDADAPFRAQEAIARMGFSVRMGESCHFKRGYLAGSDAQRADDLNRMFADREVKAIFSLRGGYGCARILDRVDYASVRKNPKILLGFSDITALHAAIFKETGLVTFHGPMPHDLKSWNDPVTQSALMRALTCVKPLGDMKNPPGQALRRVVPGRASGLLAGGNLSVVASLCATPWEIDATGKILMLEEVNEPLYRIDRMFAQLKNAGMFRACAGVLLGGFTNARDARADDGFSQAVDALAREMIPKPVLAGISAGHLLANLTVPFGVMCTMNTEEMRFSVVESALREISEV